jgi:hypothetical protein
MERAQACRDLSVQQVGICEAPAGGSAEFTFVAMMTVFCELDVLGKSSELNSAGRGEALPPQRGGVIS